jgi:hypothetical protein
MPEPGVPHIERTYFCPACGRRVSGDYNVDPARKSCTKTWHLTMVEPQKYRAVDG